MVSTSTSLKDNETILDRIVNKRQQNHNPNNGIGSVGRQQQLQEQQEQEGKELERQSENENEGKQTLTITREIPKPVEVECHRCGRRWVYGGRNLYKATCSSCLTTVSLGKFRRTKEQEAKFAEEEKRKITEFAGILASEVIARMKAEKLVLAS